MRIAIVRGADTLHELMHEAPPGDAVDARPWELNHALALRRFEPVRGTQLAEAWPALAAVTAWDDATLRRVVHVLVQTVPSGDDAGELAALGEEVHAPEPPRATAAHPRAFRGTKHRPPRPPRPMPVDVRRYLLTRRHVEQVLAQLPWAELLPEALAGAEPYIIANFGHRDDRRSVSSSALEPWFVMHVLPLLALGRAADMWPQVMQLAAVAHAAELADELELRAVLVGILAAAVHSDAADGRARVLGWWSHVLAYPRGERVEAARMVYASRAWRRRADPLDEAMAEIAAATPEQRWAIYRGFAGWATPAYLLAGLRLARSGPKLSMGDPPSGIDDVEALVRSTIAHLGDASARDSGAAFWTMHLWDMCGRAPLMTELLEDLALAPLEPRAAFWLLKLAASPSWNLTGADHEYAVLAPATRRIAACAAAVAPAYQLKLVEDLAAVYWWASDKPSSLADAISFGLRAALRTARAPFSTEPTLGTVARKWFGLAPARVDALLAAPDASFLALEDASRRENDARLLATGLSDLFAVVPDFAIAAFASHPRAVLAAADALAALSSESARDLLEAYRADPLASDAIAAAPIEALVAAAAPVVEPTGRRGPDPIRRALRDHLAQRRALSPAQLRGHHARILAALPELRCSAIRRLAERALASRAGAARIETPALRHALGMLLEADENRRALRRLLVAYVAGDRDWRARHPATQAWFARHPRIDRERWLAGATLDTGEVELRVETDPLEVLQAGTYVGSCLGRGGYFAYAAAAIALDANKHVIYARDRRGEIVGRQLVALSETDELVCFAVYGKADQLEGAFAALDHQLAAALGVSIYHYHSDDDGYDIASILSQRWWDDAAWDVPPLG